MIPPPQSSPPDDPRPPPHWIYATVQKIEAPLTGMVGLSCRQFATLSVTRIDRPLSRTEELRYRLHGALCGICGKFAAQFSLINDLTKEIEAETASSAETDHAAVARIADAVRAAVKNQKGKSPGDPDASA